MKTTNDVRHKARMRLVESEYAALLNPDTQPIPDNVYKYDKPLSENIRSSMDRHKEEIDKLIIYKAGRKMEYIKNIEHVILRVCLAEAYFEEITPYKVAIDEAIELAKEYGDDNSPTFVSGLLGGIFADKK